MREKKLSFSNPNMRMKKVQSYHTELISLFNRDLLTSVIIGNMIGPLIFVMALWGNIPDKITFFGLVL
jgi:hypothetical protein